MVTCKYYLVYKFAYLSTVWWYPATRITYFQQHCWSLAGCMYKYCNHSNFGININIKVAWGIQSFHQLKTASKLDQTSNISTYSHSDQTIRIRIRIPILFIAANINFKICFVMIQILLKDEDCDVYLCYIFRLEYSYSCFHIVLLMDGDALFCLLGEWRSMHLGPI